MSETFFGETAVSDNLEEKKGSSIMKSPIGLRAIAVSAPDRILTNDHWRETQPETVAQAEERIWMWKKPADWNEGSRAFNLEMGPYAEDPFRGAHKRRLLPEGGTGLSLEADAARKALDAAGLEPGDVDLLICTSFLPDEPGIGGSAWLAQELGLPGAAWNLESACSSALIGFNTACSLIESGQHRKVLVVTSCIYSRVSIDSDPISWGVGDAAVAMVVSEVEAGHGRLGSKSLHSADTCGAIRYELMTDDDGVPYHRLRAGKKAARVLRETSERYLMECTEGALAQAGLTIDDVDFCAFNTPLAWYASFCSRVLGVERERTISTYPFYANVGPALMGLNLFHAAHSGRVEKGDTVLLYTVGSVSSCCASVVRLGELGLGPLPAHFDTEELETFEAEAVAFRAQLDADLDAELAPAPRSAVA